MQLPVKSLIIIVTLFGIKSTSIAQDHQQQVQPSQTQSQAKRTICITGGTLAAPYLRYIAALTNKTDPRICFIPTASADNPAGINRWYELCEDLPLKPYVLRTFINSEPGQKSFQETIMSMDAIIVGGGSTLNMLAIWKAQGIDTLLKKAYKNGIILGGGSAGSMCWFSGGFTDSRPQNLSFITCLGFLEASHCPHFHSEPGRKPLYEEAIRKGTLKPGYACDDRAGILFQNEKYVSSFALDQSSHTYHITLQNGIIKEELLPTAAILR